MAKRYFEWRPIPGFEGHYEASTTGLVRSLDRTVPNRAGVMQFKKGMLRTPTVNIFGYLAIGLRKNGKLKSTFVHRLVAKTFLSNPHSKPQVNHLNGIKSDNRVENLEWVTASENLLHSHRIIGRKSNARFGELNGQSKVSDRQRLEIRRLANKMSHARVAQRYGICRSSVTYISRK